MNRDLLWWVFDLAVFAALLVAGILAGTLAVDRAVDFVRSVML
jgi:hypothetical protein